MARFELDPNRFVDLPDHPGIANRILLGIGSTDVAVAFIFDDGTTLTHVASALVPASRIAHYAASFVRAAEQLGLDWKSAPVENPPRKDWGLH